MTKFRYDINALRARAVTAVVLFHYNVVFVPGGFAGVDIFFVISGYLMTDIIAGRMERGVFSLLQFYYDRAKRIVPGLAGLCFCLLLAGYFILDPIHYNELSYSSVSALLFYSNVIFSQHQGYFDLNHNTKWLLHTWSLSVEWQFYLAYPLMLMALNRFDATRRRLAVILAVAATASLVLCILLSRSDQLAAFYLLPQRAWEMAAGGVVALKFRTLAQKYSGLLLAAGFLLIAWSLFFFNKNMDWPSYWAIAPVLGTCLVIAANQTAARPFRNKVVQTVGKWSYSAYLWHWPIAVGFVYFGFTRTNVGLVAAEILILIAILSTAALARFAARKLVDSSQTTVAAPPRAFAAARLALGFAITLGFALTVDAYRGFFDRTPEIARQVEAYKTATKDWDFPTNCDGLDSAGGLRPCTIGQSGGPRTIILGDSFSMQIYHRLEGEKEKLRGSYTFLTSSGCPPLTAIRYLRDPVRCNGYFEKAFDYALEQNPDRIVLASNWLAYFHPDNEKICFIEGQSCQQRLGDLSWFVPRLEAAFKELGERLRAFKDRGADVAIVSTTPYGSLDVPAELLKRQFLGRDIEAVSFFDREKFDRESIIVKARLAALASSVGARLIDPVDFLCDRHRCPTVGPDGVSYYRDNGHYRAAAVRDKRFRFFDDAVGVNDQLSAVPAE